MVARCVELLQHGHSVAPYTPAAACCHNSLSQEPVRHQRRLPSQGMSHSLCACGHGNCVTLLSRRVILTCAAKMTTACERGCIIIPTGGMINRQCATLAWMGGSLALHSLICRTVSRDLFQENQQPNKTNTCRMKSDCSSALPVALTSAFTFLFLSL